MTTATTRTITAALKKAGLPTELTFVSTREGYQYFVLDDGDVFETHSVYVQRASDLTIDQWIEEARNFLTSRALRLA